ncbi:MAG: hypothetical protein MUD12_01655 [Spirochaetes bacterium]|jgi:hypothetical protein|nr:hypothetical protein [Spirochaetota bacterium]
MTAVNEVLDVFKKLKTFFAILFFLLIVYIVFNLKFQWEGVYIIVNVYLYVFSFYMIFNFSSIELSHFKEEYQRKYGKKGVYYLFLLFRVVPFSIIYIITVIFTLISYLDKSDWPSMPIMDLLDGKYSNILFYSLILLVILKLKKKPQITIPFFFGLSVIYFTIYRIVITFSDSTTGPSISFLKLFQVVIALFFLINEFFFDKKNIVKSIIASLLASLIMYSSLVLLLHGIFRLSGFTSYSQTKSAVILMKMGYSYPLPELKKIVIETSRNDLLFYLIYFSRRYDYRLNLTPEQWGNLLLAGTMETADVISYYIMYKNISLPFGNVISFAERRSIDSGSKLVEALAFIKYASRYYEGNAGDFFERYERGNREYKIWTIRVMADAGSVNTAPFLLNLLTGTDEVLSKEAYRALSRSLDADPVKDLGLKRNSPEVILRFKEIYLRSRKGL